MSEPGQLLATHANCLPVGTRVAEFEIVGLIGEGGFGIVYLAKDTTLDRVVALKEFMPAAFAGRLDGVRVAVRAANHQATFDAGLKSFINEAKLLAKFAHPALVEVFRFWEANGTAYMAMRLYQGKTLRQVLSTKTEEFTEERIAQVMGPIFDALEMLHREQVFHRDIAPDNIMLADGRSVLLDFGSARRIIGDSTQALTTVLKPGYAPIEQYSDDGIMRQGAWTDVYALGGVIYHLATGGAPLQAVSRMLMDPMPTISKATGEKFSAGFSQAVAKAMSVHIDNRFQTVTEFREALGWNVGMQPRVVTVPNPPVWLEPENVPVTGVELGSPAQPIVVERKETGERAANSSARAAPTRLPLVAAVVLLCVIAGVTYWWSTKPVSAPASASSRPSPTIAASSEPAPQSTISSSPASPTLEGSGQFATPAIPTGVGTVKLEIQPRGRIDVNGVTRGLSPPVVELKLPAGKHTIDIINPADPSVRVTKTVEVGANASVTVSHTFQ